MDKPHFPRSKRTQVLERDIVLFRPILQILFGCLHLCLSLCRSHRFEIFYIALHLTHKLFVFFKNKLLLLLINLAIFYKFGKICFIIGLSGIHPFLSILIKNRLDISDVVAATTPPLNTLTAATVINVFLFIYSPPFCLTMSGV